MEGFTIEVNARDESGSASSRRYRKEGLVPSVVYYSRGEKSIPVVMSNREFSKLAKQAKTSQIFTLKSTIADLDGKPAIVKQIQLDHLKGEVVHVDFQALRENEEVSVRIGLKFTGEARGVKLDGGILTVVNHEVKVKCLPRLIPSEIQVDVTDLGMGNSLKLKDLHTPEGVKLEGNPEETVVSVVAVHVVVEEAAAAPVEGAAVEGAPAAEGAAEAAAPAEGDKEKKPAEASEKEAKGKK